jgi:hypothetical protein
VGNPAGFEERIQRRPLRSDVLAEIDVGNVAFGDEAADEPLTGAQVIASFAGGQQLVDAGGAGIAGRFG